MALEEADAATDSYTSMHLFTGSNAGLSTDAWPNGTKNAFNGSSIPSTMANDGTAQNCSVTNIPTRADSMTVTIIVGAAVNIPPVAVADSYTTAEDTAKTVAAPGVLANDTDADGNALTAVKATDPAHGALTLNANGSFTYTPATNYNGTDSFTYKAYDGTSYASAVTVSLTITPVNDAPTANANALMVIQDTPRAITLTGSDVEGSPLTYTLLTLTQHGALTGTAPALTYTPAAGYTGADAFTFTVNDGVLVSPEARIWLVVTSAVSIPIADAQSVATPEDTPKAISLTGSDPKDNAISYTVTALPAHGALSGTAPNLTYTPAADYTGLDSFTFTVNNGTLDSLEATVTITVTPVNDAPVAADDAFSLYQDTALTVAKPGVLANDTDIDGDALTATAVGGVSHGTVYLAS